MKNILRGHINIQCYCHDYNWELVWEGTPRGITIIDSVGAYTMEKRHVLMCALKENEIPRFQEEILKIDETAFIIYSESQQIVGNGFRVYK